MQRFHVIIVGFGLSAIPLIREFEHTGAEFFCISRGGDSIRDSLSASGRVVVDPKSAPIDSEKKTIHWRGFKMRFSEYIAGGDEHPHLPEITVNDDRPIAR